MKKMPAPDLNFGIFVMTYWGVVFSYAQLHRDWNIYERIDRTWRENGFMNEIILMHCLGEQGG